MNKQEKIINNAIQRMSGEVAGYVNKTELHDIQRYLSDTENIKVSGSNNKDKLRNPLGSKSVTLALGSIKTVKEAHAASPSLIPSAPREKILDAKYTKRLREILLKMGKLP
jgi:hypothetical protein